MFQAAVLPPVTYNISQQLQSSIRCCETRVTLLLLIIPALHSIKKQLSILLLQQEHVEALLSILQDVTHGPSQRDSAPDIQESLFRPTLEERLQ